MSNAAYNPGLRRLAVLTAAATLLLILAGGFVTTTDTGDTMRDWPKSWGRIEGGAWVEWIHRALAAVVGVLVLLLAVRLQRTDPRRWLRALGWIAFAAVVVQALLGGLRVHQYAPVTVAIVHATFAQVVFGAVIAVALFVSGRWRNAEANEEVAAARRVALATTILVFLQLVAGAVTRHTGSGLAVHLVNAGLVFVAGSMLASRLMATPLRRGAQHLSGLLLAQIVLGFITLAITRGGGYVASTQTPPIQVVLVTLHVALGAAFLAGSLVLTLRCYRAALPAPALELART